jgi:SNF2 family DNA or RNA helicase
MYATARILEQPAVGLFLEMGLGKSVIALTAIAELMHDRLEVQRTLVIAPLRVAQDTWSRECEKWDHLQYLKLAKILGTRQQREAALGQKADIWVINRENVDWLVEYLGRSWPFDMVVIDELSSFKSSKANRFRALRRVRPLISRIVGLTGTPAPNGLMDLWPELYLLDRGERLGKTITGYRQQYFVPGRRNRTTIFDWDPKPGSAEIIQQKISDICVSMSAADWLQLPDRIDRTIPVQLSEKAKAAYDTLERELVLDLGESEIVALTAATLANKLLQAAGGGVYDCNGGAQVVHDCKLDVLEELVEAANGQPVLVYYAYKHELTRIQKRLGGRKLESSQDINDWNAGRIPLLLAHPASAGHGLNLQDGGHHIIWFGLTWSLELYQQANARLHRQGQRYPVIVHHLIAEGTIDEQVMKVLECKAEGQNGLMEAVKARIEKVRAEA